MSTTTWTYDTLIQALQDWTEDDSDEFVDNLENIVALGQDMLIKDLELDLFQSIDTGIISAGTNEIARPANAIQIDNLWISVSNERIRLKRRSYSYCLSYWKNLNETQQPQYYATLNEDEFFIVPTPDQAYPYFAESLVRPVRLSSSNQSNWLSNNVGDMLLLACLVQADAFLMEKERRQTNRWATDYDDRLPTAKKELTAYTRKENKVVEAQPLPEVAEVTL